MTFTQDILLDDMAFTTASSDMTALKKRTEDLKAELTDWYVKLTTAMDTPAGKQMELTAKDVLIKPVDDLLVVIQHVSDTLAEIIGTSYYKGVFIKFDGLNNSIVFNKN